MFTSFSQVPNIAAGHKSPAIPSSPKPEPHGQPAHSASKNASSSSTDTYTNKTLSPSEIEELQKRCAELEKKNIYLDFENRCLHGALKDAALNRRLPATFI